MALKVDGGVGAIVQLKSETDFVAGSEQFKAEADTLVDLVAAKGTDAVAERIRARGAQDLAQGEDRARRGGALRSRPGNVIGHYEHVQGGHGVNGVLVELANGNDELAHDIAVHIAFARPKYLRPEDVPADVVEAERKTLETITRNEGKPEQALPKIVEGRLNGFFKDVCLLEQPYAKDDKQSIKQILGGALSSASPKSRSARCTLASRCARQRVRLAI